jgi:hypothetical protein
LTISTLIALTSVVISPASALSGIWLASRLTRQARLDDQGDRARQEALASLGPFAALVVDANPELVLKGELREYDSPAQAISGLYRRWLAVREPLILLWVSHPSPTVRALAFNVQAELEMVLRIAEKATRDENAGTASLHAASRSAYDELGTKVATLGRLLSPLDPERPESSRSPQWPFLVDRMSGRVVIEA